MSPPKRLVLFDIDGTILWGGPLWKECFLGAISHYFPDVNFPKVSFGGKTDIQIAREMMDAMGFDDDQINDHMHKVVDLYVERALACATTRAHEVTVLPGVRELLDELAAHPDILLGLLTGNVKKGAHAKLSCVGLEEHFKFGVFGDDHWDRYKLPPIAVARAHQMYGHHFESKQIVIIGDTVHDVNCGKSIGVRTIAVGTGHKIPMEDLLAQNPDYYFKDLSATFEVLQAILEDI
ncbi:MAG: HAD hydrolase-like protein [Deltaproteobacteria bacterium]|nr:HAD hydrolase-like protein [Deltaproteobacteria bacterium]